MLVIVAPGQGAQVPGFLTPWLELPGVPEQLAAWSDLAGRDLARVRHDSRCRRNPGHRDGAAPACRGRDGRGGRAVRPHRRGMAAVRRRRRAQRRGTRGRRDRRRGQPGRRAAPCPGARRGDGACRGHRADRHDRDSRRRRGRRARRDQRGRPHPGQRQQPGPDRRRRDDGATRRAGRRPAAGHEAAPAAGRRRVPHPPHGTGHRTRCAARRQASRSATRAPPCCPTGTAARCAPAAEWLERIVAQVSEPVRWDACMRTLAGLGASAIIELPPAGTLTGLARRALPGAALLALKTPGDLDAARSLVAAHAVNTASHTPEWRLLVAPLAGTFHAEVAVAGDDGSAERAGDGRRRTRSRGLSRQQASPARAVRGPHRRMAGRRSRPGQRRPAHRQAPARDSRMRGTPMHLPAGAPGRADPRVRRLPARQRGHQPRSRRHDRDKRRMDQKPGRHRKQPDRRAR